MWHLTGRICAERLKQAIPEWIEWYCLENSGFNPVDIQLVLQMSRGTIARHVQTFRQQENTGKSTTRRSNWWFRSHIPIKADNKGITQPGFVQADAVSHCGTNITVDYAHTVTATDIVSTWTESRAIWKKQSQGIQQALASFEESFPFPIEFLKTDSGNEFLDDRVYAFLLMREFPIQMLRSRQYCQDDQC